MVTLVNFVASAICILMLWSHLNYFIKGESLFDGSQCKMKDGRPGICRNITSCKSIDEALRKRTLPFKDLVICFFIRTTEYICCPDNVPTAPLTTSPIILFGSQASKQGSANFNTLTPLPALNILEVTLKEIDRIDENYIDLAKHLTNSSLEYQREFDGAQIPNSPVLDPAIFFSKPNGTTRQLTARVRDLKINLTTASPLLTIRTTPILQNAKYDNRNSIASRRSYWSGFNWPQRKEPKPSSTTYNQIMTTDGTSQTFSFWNSNQIKNSTVNSRSTVLVSTAAQFIGNPSLNLPTTTKTTFTLKPSNTSSVLDLWMVNILREFNSSTAPIVPTSSPTITTLSGFFNSPQEVNEISPSPTQRETPTAQPSSRAGGRKADKACSQFQSDYAKFPKPPDYHILDGEPTFLGEFPHMAAIGYPSEDQGQSSISFDCGGSLVSDQYILTAAHCVNRPERRPVLIRLGTIHLNESSPELLDVGVENIILHPEYKSSRQHHDIALIRLNTSVSFNSSIIYPACLHTDRSDIEEDVPLIATGWGSTSTETRKKSNLLLKVNLTSVDWRECNTRYLEYGQMRKLPNGLNDGQMCAIDPKNKKDTCEGDSGGPLQIVLDNKMSKLVGITSFGIDCASSIPSVYARVAFYLDWLESFIWPDI